MAQLRLSEARRLDTGRLVSGGAEGAVARRSGAAEMLALTSACAFLLANSRFFNEQLSRSSTPLVASFVSHAVGLVFLLLVAALPSARLANVNRLALNGDAGGRSRLGLLVVTPALCSAAVVFFANATAVEVRTSAAIPLFLAFVVVFSLASERRAAPISSRRLWLASATLAVASASLVLQRDLLTFRGVALGAAAAFSLVVARAALRRLSEATNSFTCCFLVHLALGAVGFVLIASRLEALSQAPVHSFLGGVLGAVFQLLLVATLRRHGELASNTLIQSEQVIFGYLTAFYL